MNRLRLLLPVLALAFSATLTAPAANLVSGSAVTCPASIGASVRLASASTKVSSLLVQAPPANAANVYVGGPNVSTTNGMVIVSGSSISFPSQANAQAWDLQQIGLVCTNTTDTVRVLYTQ